MINGEPTGESVQPSTGAPPVGTEQPIAPEAGAGSAERGNWLTSAISRWRGGGTANDSEPAPADVQADGEQSRAAGTDAEWTPPSFATKADYERHIQAENRRFLAAVDTKRQQQTEQERTAERDSQLAKLEAEKKDALAQDDLWHAGEVEKEIQKVKAGAESEADVGQVLNALQQESDGRAMAKYDMVLDALLTDVPDADRRKLLDASLATYREKSGDDPDAGWQQRRDLAASAVKFIRQQAKDQARTELRKDPVFRKEVRAEWGMSDEHEEPPLIGAAQGGAAGSDMNQWMRSARPGRRASTEVIPTPTNGHGG